ncbi:hypothetical protein BG004_005967 [Podila humilis]|nr:hypothetical protein BG004_005967 [Podila humilis]
MQSIPSIPFAINTLPIELILLILGHLDRGSLAACASTCRLWSTLCPRFFWRNFDLENAEELHRFLTSKSYQALARYSNHVQDLCIMYPSIYWLFSPPSWTPVIPEGYSSDCLVTMTDTTSINDIARPICTNLKRLELQKHLEPMLFSHITQSSLWHRVPHSSTNVYNVLFSAFTNLVKSNPALQELSIECFLQPEVLIQAIFQNLTRLEILSIERRCGYDMELTGILLELLPESIRILSISILRTRQQRWAAITTQLKTTFLGDNSRDSRASHPHLERLRIVDGLDKSPDYLCLLPFLKSCSRQLTQFQAPSIGWALEPRVFKELSRLGAKFNDIYVYDLPNRYDSSDEEIAEILKLGRDWDSIGLSVCRDLNQLTYSAILDDCQSLRVLDLGGCGEITSQQLIAILGKASQLTKFSALTYHPEYPSAESPEIQASDLVDLKWASLRLLKFCCKIRVPRHHRHVRLGREDPGEKEEEEEEESKELQRQVCRKLGEQKSLQWLELGVWCQQEIISVEDTRFQRECLEMTLETGLNELSELAQICLLDVSQMSHRIGVPELEWIERHWPKFGERSLHGMYYTCLEPVPGAREWIKGRHPEWSPDVDLESWIQ